MTRMRRNGFLVFPYCLIKLRCLADFPEFLLGFCTAVPVGMC